MNPKRALGISAILVAAAAGAAPAAGAPTLYVSGAGSDSVAAHRIAADGTLSPIGAPLPAGGTSVGLTVTPDGRNVYVANFDPAANSVSGYGIGADDALFPLLNSPFAANGRPVAVAASPDSTKLFAVNGNSAQLTVFDRGADGQLTQIAGSPFAAGITTTRGIALTPEGRYLYVANFAAGANSISGFEIEPSGVPVALIPTPAGERPIDVAVTPDGANLYALNLFDSTISAYNVGSGGGLTPLPGTATATGVVPYDLAITPDGSHLYVTNLTESTISRFSIAADGGLASLGAPTPTPGTSPTAIVTSTDGRYLYVTNNAAPEVLGYAVGTDGGLTPLAGSPFPSGVSGSDAGALDVSPDLIPPVLTLSGARKQRLDRATEVVATCDERCTASAEGTLVVVTPRERQRKLARAKSRRKFALAPAAADLTAATPATLSLGISSKGRKAAKKALRRGGKAKAKIKVGALDLAGNAASAKRTVKLKRKRRR